MSNDLCGNEGCLVIKYVTQSGHQSTEYSKGSSLGAVMTHCFVVPCACPVLPPPYAVLCRNEPKRIGFEFFLRRINSFNQLPQSG